MKKMIAAILAAGVALAPAGAQPANPFSERLQKLNELQRFSVLRRAILDSGQPCRRVDSAAIGGRYKNLVMWSARCVPGGDYGVFIGPDALVQVRPCADTGKLGLPLCRLPAVARK